MPSFLLKSFIPTPSAAPHFFFSFQDIRMHSKKPLLMARLLPCGGMPKPRTVALQSSNAGSSRGRRKGSQGQRLALSLWWRDVKPQSGWAATDWNLPKLQSKFLLHGKSVSIKGPSRWPVYWAIILIFLHKTYMSVSLYPVFACRVFKQLINHLFIPYFAMHFPIPLQITL